MNSKPTFFAQLYPLLYLSAMHTRLAILFCMLFCQVKGQVNLVPNPGFEEYHQIPCNFGPTIQFCKNWFSATGGGASPDYYSRYSLPNCYTGVPLNGFGFEEPKQGDFYSGIYLFHKTNILVGEYIEVKLSSPLLSKRYCVEFFVSLADSASNYALNNFGVLFSPDSIFLDTARRLTEYNPQIINTNNPITNKIGWTKVSGSFVAQGSEQFMVLGNFNLPQNDDTVFVGGGGNDWGIRYGYIYIDSVSVQLCDELGIGENKLEKATIYPNPAQDFVSIDMPANYPNPQLSIYNLTGQLISQQPIAANQQIPISALGNGMYIFVIQSGDKVIGRQRVVVAR
jgi:hypothetical protein